jgi:fermentation-respiration switch protein FrsA (DUF1100 family)
VLKTVLRFLLFLLIGYLFIVGLLTLLQDQLIFHPSAELWDTPERLGLEWSEHRVKTSDGVMLHGWLIGDPSDKPTIVYSHGNAGNISGRVDIAGSIANQGAAVFLYDYRGYGKSDGTPSEEGIYRDGEAVVQYLMDELSIPEQKMIFFGRSLGGAVAARQAAEFDSAGLVLDSSFISGKEIATDIYPFIPGFLIGVDFPVDEDLRRSQTEHIMILHAKSDRIVPFHHGEELYRIAQQSTDGENVKFVELRGGHNTGFSQSRDIYEQNWANFLQTLK